MAIGFNTRKHSWTWTIGLAIVFGVIFYWLHILLNWSWYLPNESSKAVAEEYRGVYQAVGTPVLTAIFASACRCLGDYSENKRKRLDPKE